MNKFGAPATSHVRLITAEDVEDENIIKEKSSQINNEENDNYEPKDEEKKDSKSE